MEQSSQPTTSAQQRIITQPKAYLGEAFLEARKYLWATFDEQLVFVGCGDDRGPTEASARALMSKQGKTVMSPTKGYASIYGGTAGLAKNVLVTGFAQYGMDFINDVKGFDGIMQLLIENSENPLTLHSAQANEQDPEHFSFHGVVPVGCAYAEGVGATSDLLVGSSSAIRDVAREDQQYVFKNDDGFEVLQRGQLMVMQHAFNGQGASFAVNREKYREYNQAYGSKLALMILEGKHIGAKGSGVVSNFSLTEVGNPVKAHQEGLDFYRLDIAVVTDIVLRALTKQLAKLNPGYILSPGLLMRAFQLDSTPVRAVLAANDDDPALQGKRDPRNLKMTVRGNPQESIGILTDRQRAGYYNRE